MELLCILDVTDAETSGFGLNIFLNCQSIRISRVSASRLNKFYCNGKPYVVTN
jgi:hypothetical protein